MLDCRTSYKLSLNGEPIAIFDNVNDIVRFIKLQYSVNINKNSIYSRLNGSVKNKSINGFTFNIVYDKNSIQKMGIKLKGE